MNAPRDLPDAGAVRAAAARLAGQAVPTPLLSSPLLDAQLGCRLLVKAECLQRTGSFKFRGAYNALAQLGAEERRAGVVAYSSGNHAQGVAAAAQCLGIPAVIVMPSDAPAIKAANTRAYGAEIVFYDRYRESREALAAGIAAKRGATLVPPFDDARIIAGQGTIGLELAEQAAAAGETIDVALASCSGGGLITGCALALAEASPGTKVFAVEPEQLDDMRRSLLAGKRVSNDPEARSICDALLSPSPGELTFALAQRLLAGGVAVSDDEVRNAMRVAFEALKLVLEPGGAAALAAVLAKKLALDGKTVAVIASGGNVDSAAFAAALAGQ
ncbi:MAG TPA: threonine/serine dehydratase [Stellaceae bacterium]|jgi:threonine dehydratase|nr:threonine/serine dehydratase [Stellaceae bacterium]